MSSRRAWIALCLTGAAVFGAAFLVTVNRSHAAQGTPPPVRSSRTVSAPPLVHKTTISIGHGLNGLNPHPIAGNFKPDGRKLRDCHAYELQCYEQSFGDIAFRKGAKAAVAAVQQESVKLLAVRADCHRIMHTIGSATLARDHGNEGEAFVQGSSYCGSGFYHGILEHALAQVHTANALIPAARSLCTSPLVHRDDYLVHQCYHGLGHGLMIHLGYYLPGALRVCAQLRGWFAQSSCAGGVFMENFNSSYGVISPYVKTTDYEYPCNAVSDRFKYECYIQVTSRVLGAAREDWQQVAAFCNTVKVPWQRVCYDSYGRDAAGFSTWHPKRALGYCRYAPNHEDYAACVSTEAATFTNNDANARRALVLCDDAGGSVKAVCYAGIGSVLQVLATTPRGVARLCRPVPARFRAECAHGQTA